MNEHDISDKPPKLGVGDEITFNSRKGKVVGYWMGGIDKKGLGYYYIVELDGRSSGYVTSNQNSRKDMYVSMCLVHIGNED